MSSIVLYGGSPEPTDPRVNPFAPQTPFPWPIEPVVPAVLESPAEENVAGLVERLRKRLAAIEARLADHEALKAEAEVIQKMLGAIDNKRGGTAT